jgi:phosphate transport system substrate-binding protein
MKSELQIKDGKWQFAVGSRQCNLLLTATTYCLLFSSCSNPYLKEGYTDNSPTSGKLKVYYDEGLASHLKNQVYTFETQYHDAHVELVETSENEAIEALYKDSCKAIFISRHLSEKENKMFESANLTPFFSNVAISGVAVITNISMPLNKLTMQEVLDLLGKSAELKDSLGNGLKVNVLFDKKNSGVMHYLLDSILQQKNFAAHCGVLGSTLETINFICQNKNTIAFIDFAWLSDVDDPLYKSNKDKLKFLGIENKNKEIVYPSQSTFKLATYPFSRGVYFYRRAGDFSLAKGFESFVAGPKGQMIFLKQGLLPTKQQERSIQVTFEPMKTQ